MKKILTSLIVVVALAASVAGGTMALFSDSDSVLGNTVSSAHLTIDAREVINKPLNDVNLLPGQWGDVGVVDLYNDGNVPQRQYMYIQNVQGDLCPYIQLKLGYSYNAQGSPHSMDVVYGTYSLSEIRGSANMHNVGRSDPVNANSTTRLVQQPYVVVDAPNSVQQATCTWDEVFYATQEGVTP